MDEPNAYKVDRRNRVVRRHERGHYDHETVHAILDSALVAHIAYVIDGQPYCTPTAFWREGTHLYWHGSSASRMVRFQGQGVPVCVTVTHLDALIAARSAFHHSVNYRSVMAFGTARKVEDQAEVRRAIDAFVDRIYPGRSAELRPPTAQEIKATSFIRMEIEQASAKIRDMHVSDDEDDYALPIWAARIPIRQVVGAFEPCPRLDPTLPTPPGLAHYQPDRALDQTLSATARPA